MNSLVKKYKDFKGIDLYANEKENNQQYDELERIVSKYSSYKKRENYIDVMKTSPTNTNHIKVSEVQSPIQKEKNSYWSDQWKNLKKSGMDSLQKLIKIQDTTSYTDHNKEFNKTLEKINEKRAENKLPQFNTVKTDKEIRNGAIKEIEDKKAKLNYDKSDYNAIQKGTDFAVSQVPSIAEFALLKKIPGMGGFNTGTTKIASKLTPFKEGAIKNISQSAVKGGIDMGVYGGTTSALQGNKTSQVLKDTGESALGGILFGAGGKAISEGVKIPFKNKNIPKIETKTDTDIKMATEPIVSNFNIKKVNTPLKGNKPTTKVSNGKNIVNEMKSSNNIPKTESVKLTPLKFVDNSVKNSKIAPDEMKETIGVPLGETLTNKETWGKAVKKVEEDYTKHLREFSSKKEVTSADDTALGQALIDKAIKNGNVAEANELSIDLATKLRQAGQTVQASYIFKRLTPEGMLQYANRTFTKFNEKITQESKKIKLSTEETEELLNRMRKAQTMEDGRAKDVELGRVFRIIDNKTPSTIVDKTRALRNISLLGNAKTNTRNIGGNALMGVTDNIANIVATPIDKLISLKTNQRTATIPSFKTQGKGFVNGGKIALSDSLGGLSKSELKGLSNKNKIKAVYEGAKNPINSQSTKFETGNTLAFKNTPLRLAENMMGTTLKMGDNTFKTAYYDDVLRQLMKSNNVKVPTTKMKELAESVALERTYQDTNGISKLISGIKNAPQKMNDGPAKDTLQIITDSILPFAKTPANLLKRGIEYSPMGIVEGGAKLTKALKNNNLDMATQRQIVDRFGRGIVGSGIMGAGALLSEKDIVTGARDKDKDIAALNSQTGKQANSIKLPNNKYINYDWLQPVSLSFGAGAQMVKGKKGEGLNNTIDGITNALNYYSEQPMLQSVQRFIGNGYDGKNLGEKLFDASLELPKQYTPTALKQLAQRTDDNSRNTYSDKYLEKSLINPIKAKLPRVSKTLPKKYDTLGREVLQYQGNNNSFNTFVNPAFVTKDTTTEVEKMIYDVYNSTGDNTIFPRVAPKYISVGGKRYDLTGEEQSEYQRYVGDMTYMSFKDINTKDKLSNQEKAKQMKSAIDRANKAGREHILKNR